MRVLSKILLSLVTAAISFATTNALALTDRIELINGSIIIGTFLDADGGTITVDTEFAGTLSIRQSQVASMDVKTPVTLQMDDGSIVETEGLVVANKTLSLDTSSQASYGLDHLLRINPEPWELGRGYHHTGLASTAFTLQRGNTSIDELDYKIDTRWTGRDDRFTAKLEGENREANGDRTAENWTITGKYDRFQAGDYYWGLSASAEENRFADLELRTAIGPYLGRDLFETSPFVLEVETGLSYVSEDFGDLADREYIGLTWSVRSESNHFGSNSRLYVDHTGVKNLDENDNLILNTTIGIGFPLLGWLQGATELVLNYNSGAVEGTEELDQTYRFRLGYNW